MYNSKEAPLRCSINERYNFIVITEKSVKKKKKDYQTVGFFFFFFRNNYFIKSYQICIFFPSSMCRHLPGQEADPAEVEWQSSNYHAPP